MNKLSVILINYLGWRDTLACIASLREQDYAPLEIIVVENGSPDDSWEHLSQLGDVRLLRFDRNLGFAGGCNAGMRAALAGGAEFVWLLNNDTLAEPHAASALVGLAQQRPDAHFFGSLISFEAEPSLLWYGGGTFDWLTGKPRHAGFGQPVASFVASEPVPTDWISGCSVLLRARSLEAVGFMDEDLFLYAEDLEWQLRAARARPVAWIARECLVRHKVGRSTGSTDNEMGHLFMSRNFLKIARRHAGVRLPLWLGRWSFEFILKPALRGRYRLARAGLAGLAVQRIGGAEIVTRARQPRGPRQAG